MRAADGRAFAAQRSVVIAELGDEQRVRFNLVDNPMFICDTARPVPRQAMFQRLGLANPSERGTLGPGSRY